VEIGFGDSTLTWVVINGYVQVKVINNSMHWWFAKVRLVKGNTILVIGKF